MRRPTETFAQRRLVYELRALIDRGRMEEAASVASAHPRGMRSRHVIHNLGRARARALLVHTEAARSGSFDVLISSSRSEGFSFDG